MKLSFAFASAEQAPALSDIAILSKGYWGYPKEKLELWREGLRITESYIAENHVRVVQADQTLVGFFAIKQQRPVAVLDHLWLRPEAIGKGYGKRAFQKIVDDCRTLDIARFQIISDPNAEGFYRTQGATRIGTEHSVPQGRKLPKLEFRVPSV